MLEEFLKVIFNTWQKKALIEINADKIIDSANDYLSLQHVITNFLLSF